MAYTFTPESWQVTPQPNYLIKNKSPFLPLLLIVTCLGTLITGLNILILGLFFPLASFYGLILALLPLFVLLAYYFHLDKYEPKLKNLLIMAFIWGALGATGFALITNALGTAFFGEIFTVIVSAPIGEELFKGMFLFFILWWKKDHLNGILAGIVYAGFIGVGFAFVENVVYLTASFAGLSISGTELQGGTSTLFVTFVLRGLVTPFAHPLFTAFTGIGVGIAVSSRRPLIKIIAPLGGLAVAIILHALWNASSLLGGPGFFVVAYILFFVPVFLAFLYFVHKEKRKSGLYLKTALENLAYKGSLPMEDIPWIIEPKLRTAALAYALRQGGVMGKQNMKTYQEAALRLGFLHGKVLLGVAPTDYRAIAHDYFTEIVRARPLIGFPHSHHNS